MSNEQSALTIEEVSTELTAGGIEESLDERAEQGLINGR